MKTGDIDGNAIKDGDLQGDSDDNKNDIDYIKLMVRIFIIELMTEMAVMLKMLVMREVDDQVSIILVF